MRSAAIRPATTLLVLALLAPLHPVWGQQDAEVPLPTGMQKVFVQYPALNIDAFEVFIPVKWHFEEAAAARLEMGYEPNDRQRPERLPAAEGADGGPGSAEWTASA
jgi:hypothetical protein